MMYTKDNDFIQSNVLLEKRMIQGIQMNGFFEFSIRRESR